MENDTTGESWEYHGSVWTTWIISFNEIRNKDATGMAAANLLILWSCLSNRDILHELFPQRDRKLQACFPQWMNEVASSRIKFTQVMRLLSRYSMVEPVDERGRYSTHPVVHKWVYHYFYDTISKTMARFAITLVGNVYRILSEYEEIAFRILPHVESCRNRILVDEEVMKVIDSRDNGELEHDNVLELAYRSAKEDLLKNDQLFIQLDRICKDREQELRSLEDKLGFDDPSMIDASLSLGRVYRERNRLEDATRMGEWTLERLRESRYSMAKLEAMNFLGELYLYQSKVGDASRILESAWVERKSAPSSGHPFDNQITSKLVFITTAFHLEKDRYDQATLSMELIQLHDEEDSGPVAELRLRDLHRLGVLYLITGKRIEVHNLHEIVTKYSEEADRVLRSNKRLISSLYSEEEDRVLRSNAISSLWQHFNMEWSDEDKRKLVDAQNAYQKARQASNARGDGDTLGNGLAKHFLSCSWNLTQTQDIRHLSWGIEFKHMIDSVSSLVEDNTP